jgi:acyl-CoA thioesterase
MPPSNLAEATQVTRVERAPGWYTADLPDDWSYFTPSGGVLMTVAMRAMRAEIGDEAFVPVSATTVFMSRVPAGPLETRVEVMRGGNAACQVRAALSSTATPEPGLEVSATFARRRKGPDAYGRQMPEVAAPEDCEDAGDRAIMADPAKTRPVRPFFRNLDMRLALGAPVWRQGWEQGEARMAFWYRYRVDQRVNGVIDPLAIPPIADTMPSALARRLGPDHPRFFAPSLDLTVHFLDPGETDWYLVDVRCPRARDGYASAHADVWDQDGRLVAFATQTMMLRSRPKRRV